MNRSGFLSLLAAAVITVAAATNSARADDLASLAGTWELNVAQSKFTPGTEIKSQTRVYEIKGDEVKQTTDSVDARGASVQNHWTARYDGKDYNLEDNPDANTISIQITGDLTGKTVLKKDGKVVQTVLRTLSKDGKTCTFKYHGVNAKGLKINNVLVFDRRRGLPTGR